MGRDRHPKTSVDRLSDWIHQNKSIFFDLSTTEKDKEKKYRPWLSATINWNILNGFLNRLLYSDFVLITDEFMKGGFGQSLFAEVECRLGIPSIVTGCDLATTNDPIARVTLLTYLELVRHTLGDELCHGIWRGYSDKRFPADNSVSCVDCAKCGEKPYLLERCLVEGVSLFHRRCFVCVRCSRQLRKGTYRSADDAPAGQADDGATFECLSHERDDFEHTLATVSAQQPNATLKPEEHTKTPTETTVAALSDVPVIPPSPKERCSVVTELPIENEYADLDSAAETQVAAHDCTKASDDPVSGEEEQDLSVATRPPVIPKLASSSQIESPGDGSGAGLTKQDDFTGDQMAEVPLAVGANDSKVSHRTSLVPTDLDAVAAKLDSATLSCMTNVASEEATSSAVPTVASRTADRTGSGVEEEASDPRVSTAPAHDVCESPEKPLLLVTSFEEEIPVSVAFDAANQELPSPTPPPIRDGRDQKDDTSISAGHDQKKDDTTISAEQDHKDDTTISVEQNQKKDDTTISAEQDLKKDDTLISERRPVPPPRRKKHNRPASSANSNTESNPGSSKTSPLASPRRCKPSQKPAVAPKPLALCRHSTAADGQPMSDRSSVVSGHPPVAPRSKTDLFEEYPDYLNPFGSDEGQTSDSEEEHDTPAKDVVLKSVYDETLNPFGDDDDDTEVSDVGKKAPVARPRYSLIDPTSRDGATSADESKRLSTPVTDAARRSLSPYSRQKRRAPEAPLPGTSDRPKLKPPTPPLRPPSFAVSSARKKRHAPPPPVPYKRKIEMTGCAAPQTLVEVGHELEQLDQCQHRLEVRAKQLEAELLFLVVQEPDSWEKNSKLEEWLLAVDEKGDLLRKESTLVHRWREMYLDDFHSDLEYQIRCIIEKPESDKSDADIMKEAKLLQMMLEVIERKNQLVENYKPSAVVDWDDMAEVEEERKRHHKVKKKKLKLKIKTLKKKMSTQDNEEQKHI